MSGADNAAKPVLGVVGSGAAGFYLGGRYVGQLAAPVFVLDKPAWISQAKSTLWVAMAVCLICSVAWMALDYREVNNG